jgi:uncharacterized membrane protein YeaQ/YmgE (transglycosylase-associated protein family)
MFVAWILLGLFSGFVACMLVRTSGGGIVLDFALGVVGATGGGFVFAVLGEDDMDDSRLWSLFGAAIGAVVILAIARAAAAREAVHVRAPGNTEWPASPRRGRPFDHAPVLRIRPGELRTGRWLEP